MAGSPRMLGLMPWYQTVTVRETHLWPNIHASWKLG